MAVVPSDAIDRSISVSILLAAVAAVVVLAMSASRLIWLFLAGAGHDVALQGPGRAAPSLAVMTDYSVLERVTPFKSELDRTVVATEIIAEETPETTLDLELAGITLRPSDGAGEVKISKDGGPQMSYGLGDEISPGVTVHRIYADGILLRREGRNERLPLKTKPPNAGILTLNAPQSADIRIGTNPVEPAPAPAEIAPEPVDRPIRESLATITRSEALLLAQSVLSVPEIGEQDYGVSIFFSRNHELAAKAGLKRGDVIQDIGGVRINAEADLERVLVGLQDETEVTVFLWREGEGRQKLVLRLAEE